MPAVFFEDLTDAEELDLLEAYVKLRRAGHGLEAFPNCLEPPSVYEPADLTAAWDRDAELLRGEIARIAELRAEAS